jgi:beta-N-acetylhexosaminidase
MAQDLLNLGINLSLAPVLDLHNNSTIIGSLDRAFHSSPEIVVKLATAFIKGMQLAGMPAVGKHFPGHSAVITDSHVSRSQSTLSLEKLYINDLYPFIELIKANLLAAIMPAHITYTLVDPNYPAGFSKIWLQEILRHKFNFQGLIISDCLSMKGAEIGSMHTRAQQAIDAGCNMVIICNQSRPYLQHLLDNFTSINLSSSIKYIELFKQKLKGLACAF